MAALDASAEWSALWRQLSQLGWRQEQQTRKSNTYYYIPPSMTSMQKSKSTQRDYYDTREQVREYLLGLKDAKSAATGQRSRYDSSRGAADRPGKRARDTASADDEHGERDRKRTTAAPTGRPRDANDDSDSSGGTYADGSAAAAAPGDSDARAESEGSADEDEEQRRIVEAAHEHSRGGRRARLIDVPKHLYTNDFAAAAHAYIKEQGMSQDALASRTGLRQQQISGWLFGKCSASMHEMVESALRSWFQQRGVDLDTPGTKPDLAEEDKIKLFSPLLVPQGFKKHKTESSASGGRPESFDEEEIPDDGTWFSGELVAVTSDGQNAAPFWLGVCLEKRRVTARKIRVSWLKATSGIGPAGPLDYTKDSNYVFDDDTDPEQIFADTVLFRTNRRVGMDGCSATISLSEAEFRGALDAAEQYALANQTSGESEGSGSEDDEAVELSLEEQVSEAVKDWALKALIFSGEYETHGGLTVTDVVNRFKESKHGLDHEVSAPTVHTGILEAVQSVLGKAVRPEDIRTAEDNGNDSPCRYYARFRVGGDMEGTGGWSVARALPQVNRARRIRKKARPLSPDPSGKGPSARFSPTDQDKPSAWRRRLSESKGPKDSAMAKAIGERARSDRPRAGDIDWAWLCQNCLARNLEQATSCIDCSERRSSTVDEIACADDGCNWACYPNGQPISTFNTAVGYDTRMLLHKQTSKQTLKYAGNSDTESPDSSEQAVRDVMDHLVASVESQSSSGLVEPEVLSEHPERPDRASCTFRRLQHLGLLENTVGVEDNLAAPDEIQSAHGVGYVESIIQQTIQASSLEDSYINSNTPLAAQVAAGTTSAVVRKVIKGEAANGVAVVRPPGHHACSDKASGFCYFNNVAVAARTAQKQGIKRILIVDWGIHHGNGTQEIFYDDPSVLTVSLHRGDPGFFPQSGKPDEVGRGRAEGFNVNVAWSSAGMGDAEYLLAFSRLVTPIALQFQPELVIVAAGFDSGKGDPWGECSLTVPGYAALTSQLMNLSGGKLVLVLEGGYNLKTVSHSLAACVRVLRGAPPPPIPDMAPPVSSALRDIRITENRAAQYWSVFGCSRAASVEEMEEIENSTAGGMAIPRMHSQLGDLNMLTVVQLRKLCVTRKLGTKGQKVDLVAKLHADDRNVIDADRIWFLKGHRFIGRRLRRSFQGFGDVEGAVHAWHDKGIDGYVFHVVHDDGDEEDLGVVEVEQAFAMLGDDSPIENGDSDEDQPRLEGHWTKGEQRRFHEAMTGEVCDKRDWHAVSMHVGTRTIDQCKSYARAKRLPVIQPVVQPVLQPSKPSNEIDKAVKQEKGVEESASGKRRLVTTMVSRACLLLGSTQMRDLK